MSDLPPVSCEIATIKIEIEVSETQLQEQTWEGCSQITNIVIASSDSATLCEVKNEKHPIIQTKYGGSKITFQCPKCLMHFGKRKLLQCHVRRDHHDLCKKVHFCRICSKSFSLKSLLSIHMNSHSEKACPLCNEILASSKALRNHVASIHADQIKFVCTVCFQVSSDSQDHNVHVCNHSFRSRYKCNECLKCYASFGGLERHSRKHLGIIDGNDCINYKCLVCSKIFPYEKLLHLHMESHIGARPNKCDQCPKKFDTLRNLCRHQTKKTYASKRFLGYHMNMHRGIRPFSCDHCPKTYSSVSSFYQHYRKHSHLKCDQCPKKNGQKDRLETFAACTHKNYECSLCSKSYRFKRDLTYHMNTHTGSRPYKCEKCPKTFTNPRHLGYHRRYYSSTNKCSICSKTYCSKQDLAFHMNHHSEEQPFACDQCPKRYASLGSLQRHGRKHSKPIENRDQSKFKCSLCPKAYREKRSLNFHMNSHTGACPFKCSQCPNAFTNPNSLRRHELLHKSDKFQCTKCDKVYASHIRLRRHTKRTHDIGNKYSCKKCARTFRNPEVFRNHVKNHGKRRTNNQHSKHICTVCKTPHNSKATLRAHMKLHRDEYPFKCEICPKVFLSEVSLQNHTLWHSYEKKYECTICDKIFFWDWQRLRHENLHSNAAKPFKCEMCMKYLLSKEQLINHVKSKKCRRVNLNDQDDNFTRTRQQTLQESNTGETASLQNAPEKYKCSECNKEFISKRNLVFHTSKHKQ